MAEKKAVKKPNFGFKPPPSMKATPHKEQDGNDESSNID